VSPSIVCSMHALHLHIRRVTFRWEPTMEFEVTHAMQQRPMQTTWASGLMVAGGGFFVIPLAGTFIFGVIGKLAPGSLSLLLFITAVGIAQLGIAVGAWRGMVWPRWTALFVIAASVVGMVVGYVFLALGVLLVGSATILLWRPAARRWSASMTQARRWHRPSVIRVEGLRLRRRGSP
jgi:hypothetical protein